MNLPRLIVTDIDGVWTDGGMYYDKENGELKKFNTSDSVGVLWCKMNDIPVAIITGENTSIVQRRAEKLGLQHVFLGVKNKIKVLGELIESMGISWEQVAYIGDDINDWLVLDKVGFSGCPENTPSYIKSTVDYASPVKGGDGAFRDFVEHILSENNLLQPTLDRYKEENRALNQ